MADSVFPQQRKDLLLTHALALVAKRFLVFQCTIGEKPAISREDGGRGCLDATTNAFRQQAMANEYHVVRTSRLHHGSL
jgi:hypothetical protein